MLVALTQGGNVKIIHNYLASRKPDAYTSSFMVPPASLQTTLARICSPDAAPCSSQQPPPSQWPGRGISVVLQWCFSCVSVLLNTNETPLKHCNAAMLKHY